MDSDLFFTGVVERLASNGCGVIRCHDSNFFVYGAAAGEKVVCKKTAGFNAELIEILRPSSDRTPPRCNYYGRCGGCSLRHINYEAQVREKTTILHDAFRYSGGISELPPVSIHKSPPDGYRDRVQFHKTVYSRPSITRKTLLTNNNTPPFGFMERYSNTIIPLDDCPVLNSTLRAVLSHGSITPPIEKDRFAVYGREGTLISEGGVSRKEFRFIAGGAAETVMVDAGVFFQSNGVMLEQLIERLLEIAAESTALPAGDFYSGVGVFAVFLRRLFSCIDVLEENRAAVELARANIGVENGVFYALSDSAWVKRHGAKAKSYGFLCVDPGRQGLSPAMRNWLCTKRPATLAYISCEPSALARDARSLCTAGFLLASLDFFDFYPQTSRIETLAVFKRNV